MPLLGMEQTFVRERACKHSIRYVPTGPITSVESLDTEAQNPEPKHLSSVIYIHKPVLDRLGHPDKLLIRFEPLK